MPHPIHWSVPTPLTPEETHVTGLIRRSGKFYLFLRQIRHELFDDAFQATLAAGYRPRGTAPVPPALLAGVAVLGGLGAREQPPSASIVDSRDEAGMRFVRPLS